MSVKGREATSDGHTVDYMPLRSLNILPIKIKNKKKKERNTASVKFNSHTNK